jgi:hypothetical protein
MECNCPSLPTLRSPPSFARHQEDADCGKIAPVGPEYRCREALRDFVAQKRQLFVV